jgi:hypothetical protein
MRGFCSSTQQSQLHYASGRAQNSNDMIKDLCGLFFCMSGSKFKWHDQGLCLSEDQSLVCMHTESQVYRMKAGFSLPTIHSFWTLQHTSVLLEVDFRYNKNYSSSSALSRTCYITVKLWWYGYFTIYHIYFTLKMNETINLYHTCLMNHMRYLLLDISFVYIFVIITQFNAMWIGFQLFFLGCLWGWSVYPLKKHIFFNFAFLLWA